MRSLGFTLIDLLTTLAVLSILCMLGLPNFTTQIHHSRVNAATQDLLDALEITRTKAVATNSRATLQKQNNWEDGWEVFVDENNDGVRNNDEITIQQHEELPGVRIKANSHIESYVSYIGSGESRNASGSNFAGAFQVGTFTICADGKAKGYELILSRGGRVRKHEISEQDCAAI